jgi:hypothetical protein
MPDLFPDVRCPSCGRPHTFRDSGAGRHPAGSLYSFTCPATEQVATFRSPAPEPVILCPAGTLPAQWVGD